MKKTVKELTEEHAPWKLPKFEPADAAAIQALGKGQATADQQKRAIDWIVTKLCSTYDFPYRPGDTDRDTNIALGKMWVGQQLVYMLKVKIGLITRRQP